MGKLEGNDTFPNIQGHVSTRLSRQEPQISSFLLIICAVALFVNGFL